MRPSPSAPALTLALTFALTACVGPFSPRHTASAPAHAEPKAGEPPAPAGGLAPSPAEEPGCDDASESAAAPVTMAEEGTEGEPASLDDGFEVTHDEGPSGPLPFADLSDAAIASRLRSDIGALGSMSLGAAHSGVLVAGVRMPEGENWQLVSPALSWGTKETTDAIAHAIDAVASRFPSTPKAFVGNLSARYGGHLPPHVSHQSGRDVDLGYYLTEGHRWYAGANASNLDRARTWHLVRTFLADSDVDLILIDTQVQRLLKSYALSIGEDQAWLDQIFQVGGKSRRPTIFHAKGHATHLHVRFYSPAARELGRRAYRILVARRVVAPPTLFVTHTTKSGETLSHLATRYKVTKEAIKKANAMTSDVLRVNKPYKIPQIGGIPMPAPVTVPARHVPPSPLVVASAKRPSAVPCRRASLAP